MEHPMRPGARKSEEPHGETHPCRYGVAIRGRHLERPLTGRCFCVGPEAFLNNAMKQAIHILECGHNFVYEVEFATERLHPEAD